MNKIVTFGEIMLRFAPEGYYRFTQANKFNAVFGGGEANVAVALANFNANVSFVTKLPKHEIGQAVLNELRRYGVDTSDIARGGDRVGVYYCERGASQRPSKVIYDRAHSAIADSAPEDFDWDKIFAGAKWFHFTGITPALGGKLPDICLEACKKAKKLGLKISCDLNYRKKLWTKEKAREVMTTLMPYVNVIIANEEDAGDVFGIIAENSDITVGKLFQEEYKSVAKQLYDMFGFDKIGITLRSSKNANDNRWSGMLFDGKDYYFGKSYDIHIVDRVGGGDSFAAGLIYGELNAFDSQRQIEFAVAASCLKHTVEGDFNMVSVSEVENLVGGDASGRVQR